MRNNLRLDWRALALLGALLTIMIKWPGEAGGMGLVHAMPIITTTTTNNPPTPITIRDFLAEEETPITTTIKPPINMKINEIITKSYRNNDANKNVVDINNNTELLLLLLLTTTSANADVISDDTTPVYIVNNEKITTTEQSNNNGNNNNSNHLENSKINRNDNDSDDYNNSNKNIEVVTKSEKYQHSSNQILNPQPPSIPPLISLKKFSDFEHKTQLNSNAQEFHNFQSSKNQNLISNRRKRKKINNNQMHENVGVELQNNQQGKKNYSISNEIIRNISEIESKKLVVDHNVENVMVNVDKKLTSLATVAEKEQFKFSSHNNITILSRTERSLQEETVGDNIVRRSPHITHSSNVGGLKSRRLNISKIQQNRKQQQAVNNNLDRNERSTISHFTGASRKIQMFIKNRYLQLLPDGTINGTQDASSEYCK